MNRPPGPEQRASALLGLLMVVAGVVVLVDAARLPGSDEALGPAAAPTLIGVLLGLLGGGLLVQARGSLRTGNGKPRRLWRLTALVATLLAFAFLLPIMGFVFCAAVLFVSAALLLGAPHPARVVAYGWTLAVVVFLVFDVLIGLSLPAGPWGF
ncbi:tripartite tricarboxylate transporter TctB family protein [Actinoplanes sp. LDG1-06]|uniref:Tripartite tricarboxylate transporter TctB family protein n=1 Tax=Paractinoplanes ovalisporus TaxID=2810368 RepID=A0ABS2A475_9ACTN|nr:tripartite tricarboxylate transporter TctB family protein [Actinoplanes ovalisporus]MBM2614654.1 tripartite tricarboxylate transporter TctB family protein [Actinoplanes ovalisporus]